MFDRICGGGGVLCLTVFARGGGVLCLTVDNCPESQRSVDNPKNGPQKRSKPLCGGW